MWTWIQDQQPTKEAAFDKIIKNGSIRGAVVLLHSTSSTNAQILDELLTKWEEMGLSFCTTVGTGRENLKEAAKLFQSRKKLTGGIFPNEKDQPVAVCKTTG